MERDLRRALAKKRSTFPVDLNVPAVIITNGQNEIGYNNGDSKAHKTVQTISNITASAPSAFQVHGKNQVGTSAGTHTGPYVSLLLGFDGRSIDGIPVNNIDDMVRRSQIRYPHGNVGGSISYFGHSPSFYLPTNHEHFLNGSGGVMDSACPLNNTFPGYMQSRAANIMGSEKSPTNMQSQYVGGSVPPGHWDGFNSRRLSSPAENTGSTWVDRSPSPLVAGNYSIMGSNLPIGFMSNSNARQNAFQLAGSLNNPHWRGNNAMASSNQSWSGYRNQFAGGGFLTASPGNNTAPRNWFHMGGHTHNHQTKDPQLDASFLGTWLAGSGTGGSQSLTYNPRVYNTNSDVIILSSEKTATYDFNSIMKGAVKGVYEFDYWTAHGRLPSPTKAGSSVPPQPCGSSSEPQLQGKNTEQLVSIANDALPVPEPSPSFPSPISDKQAGKAIVSSID